MSEPRPLNRRALRGIRKEIIRLQRDELRDLFKKEVHDKAAQVDPSNEEHWGSLTLGWAIAKGLTPEEAGEFASWIRYHTDLG